MEYEENRYKFLFPYEKIVPGSKVIIYGAGNTGIEYIKQLIITEYAIIVAVVDKSFKSFNDWLIPVISVNDINKYNYDYIVIAQKNKYYTDEIINGLLLQGVNKEKIIFEGERDIWNEWRRNKNEGNNHSPAYLKKGISIAIKVSPGLGDSIIIKKLIVRICEIIPEANIDVYGTGISKFGKAFYSDLNCINGLIEPNVALYEDECHNYMLSLFWQEYLLIESYKREEIRNINEYAVIILDKLNKAINDYGIGRSTVNSIYIHLMRCFYTGRNIYNACYYQDVLGIYDGIVNIPVDKEQSERIREITPEKYITINYGNGILSDTMSKQWSFERFEKLVHLLVNKYKDIKILQLGGENAKVIDGCYDYYFNESLETVKVLLKDSILHIDIEGGLVHLATMMGTKCVVIFGSTQEWFFGYKENINIVPSVCGNCAFLGDKPYECVAHNDLPLCLDSITVERVFDEIMNALDKDSQERSQKNISEWT